MEINQIENLYKINGIKDYQLRDTFDLLKIHGIDFKAIEGYKRLDDLNNVHYEKFIINFLNGLGLESRAALIPKGIYWVEDIQYLVKENIEDDYFVVAGGIVNVVDRNGMKSVLRSWTDEDYKDFEIVETESTNYLRFVYEHHGRAEWLHVIKEGKEWY